MRLQILSAINRFESSQGFTWDKFIISNNFAFLKSLFGDAFFTNHIGISHRTIFEKCQFFFSDTQEPDVMEEALPKYLYEQSAKERK